MYLPKAWTDHFNTTPNSFPTPINLSPTALSFCPYPPSHTSFSFPTSLESPRSFSALLLSSQQAPLQPCRRRIDYNQISQPILPVSTYTDLHFAVFLSPRSPSAAGGTFSHMVCACGRLVVAVCQAGRRGWRAGGIERGEPGAGHWPGGRLKEYGRETERRTVD